MSEINQAMRICGQWIEVIYNDPQSWSGDGMGRANEARGHILIKDDMPVGARNNTLLHEILHLIASMNGLAALNDDETTISVLASSLHAWMQDNPEWVRRIVSNE